MRPIARRCKVTPMTKSILDELFAPNLDATLKTLWNEAFADRSRIFDVFDNSARYPKADAKLTESGIEIDLAVPGHKKEEVEILFEEGVLTVKYKKIKEKRSKEVIKVLFNELRHSSWSRAWTIIGEIKEEEITATLKNGILTVLVPYLEPQVEQKPKPRKISITDNSPDDIEVTE